MAKLKEVIFGPLSARIGPQVGATRVDMAITLGRFYLGLEQI